MTTYPPYRVLESRTLRSTWEPRGRILHLASGQDYREPTEETRWVNVDRYAKQADERLDLLDFPWPWGDATFDAALSHQFLEHVPPTIQGQDALLALLNEAARVIKPGGRFLFSTPYAGASTDYTNLTHYRRFTKRSFDWLGSGDDLDVQSGRVPFRLVRVKVIRLFRFTKWFDSSYHVPKHLGFFLNVGRKSGLVFILDRVPNDS